MLTLTLPSRQYDQYCADALRAAVSVPEIVRRQLEQKKLKTRHQK